MSEKNQEFYTEIITNYVMERIISYAYHELKTKVYSENISKYCFEDFTTNLIENFLENQLICYDKDEYPISKLRKSKSIYGVVEDSMFYNNAYSGKNNWCIIREPKASKIDRNADTAIKTIRINEEEKQLNQTRTRINECNNNDPQIKKKEKISFSRISTLIQNNKGNKNKGSIIKKKSLKLQSLPSRLKDLEDEVIVSDESFSIKKMREEMQMEIQKNEEAIEQKKIQEMNMSQKINELLRKQKEYDKKNVTADHTGNVILIKNIESDRLMTDFFIPKIIYKEQVEQLPLITNRITDKKELNKTSPIEPLLIEENLKKKDKLGTRKSIIKQIFPQKMLTREIKVIQPAGSNFDQFNPEVGVIVREGDKSKSGGNAFSSYFSKASKNDYINLIKSNTHRGDFQNEITESESDKPFEIKNLKQLPKISSTKAFKLFENSMMKNKTDLNEKIKINSNILNLKEMLDNLEFNNKFEGEKNVVTENFFNTKNNILHTKNEKFKKGINISLDEVNKFNLNIIKNNNWGKDSFSGSNLISPREFHKPNLIPIENLQGITNKIMRNRKK